MKCWRYFGNVYGFCYANLLLVIEITHVVFSFVSKTLSHVGEAVSRESVLDSNLF